MKKVLFITNIPSPYRVDFFSKFGELVDLTVWFENEKVNYRQWKSSIENKNFKHKVLNFKNKSLKNNIINLHKEFKKNKYDIYIVGGYSTLIGILSIIYLKLKRKKFVLNADGGFVKNDSKKSYFIKKMLISSANYWLSSGKNCTEYLIHYGAKKDNVFEYPFASIDYTSNELKPLNDIERKKLKKDKSLKDIVILSIGSFIDRKGLDILIKSFENIRNRNEELKISLVLIGGGELKDKYISYINDNKIEDITIIDFLDKEDLIMYYKLADMFILPTREDIWGLVVNEAMSFGLPIICSDRAGAGLDLMIDNKNGFLFESENIDDLSLKIECLVNDESKRKEFSKESLNIIKNYSSTEMSKRHKKIITSIQN